MPNVGLGMGTHFVWVESTSLHELSADTTGMYCTRSKHNVTCKLCLEIIETQNLNDWIGLRWRQEFFGGPDPVLVLRSKNG